MGRTLGCAPPTVRGVDSRSSGPEGPGPPQPLGCPTTPAGRGRALAPSATVGGGALNSWVSSQGGLNLSASPPPRGEGWLLGRSKSEAPTALCPLHMCPLVCSCSLPILARARGGARSGVLFLGVVLREPSERSPGHGGARTPRSFGEAVETAGVSSGWKLTPLDG